MPFHFANRQKQTRTNRNLTKQTSSPQQPNPTQRKCLPTNTSHPHLMPRRRNKFLTLVLVNPQFHRNLLICLAPPPLNIRMHHTLKPPTLNPRPTLQRSNIKGGEGVRGWGVGRHDCTTSQVYFSAV